MSELKKEKPIELVPQDEDKKNELLIERDEYLAAGIHIGTRFKTRDSEKWIFRVTSYGLYVINLLDTDKRIRVAANFLSKFDPEKILICSVRRYGIQPVKAFCEQVGSKSIHSRFIPGTLTNPDISTFVEPDVIIIIDPHADKQALAESVKARIPVVALIDTDDFLTNVDLAIPTNNRGRKALSKVLWLLARQILRERGDIPTDGDLPVDADHFISKITQTKDL